MRRLTLALLALALGCGPAPEPASVASGAPPADAVVVRISYGSEKKSFLTDSIDAFHRSAAKTKAGHPIRIEAVAEGSAEAMESILAGRADVQVWSPASTLLVDVLNDRWIEKQGGLGAAKPLVAEAPPLVLSPVVLAMWEPMARALGWPDKSPGWQDVARFATSGADWSRYGHPEWGPFRFGHTHPRYSNSGALALVAATYAGAGKTRALEAADVEKARGFVKDVQASVVHYGRSTGFFADKMFLRGPGYLSAAVLYENLVVEASTDAKYAAKPFPVVAVYPREGTFWSDHPYAVLDLPSMTAEQREAALAFRDFLLGAERQRAALRFGFRPADPSVPLGAPIDAEHGVDPAQPRNVLPNPAVAVTRRVLDTFELVKRPVAVTFVLDTSGSMKGDALLQAKTGARTFLQGLPESDTARVLLFSARPRWIAREAQVVGRARPQLLAAIDGAFADGGTALYDAIREGLAPGAGEPRGAARAVVILTDGEDTDSSTQLPELLAELRGRTSETEEPVRVFAIAYGDKAKPEVLQQIADAAGGAFFSGTPKDIQSLYAELASFF